MYLMETDETLSLTECKKYYEETSKKDKPRKRFIVSDRCLQMLGYRKFLALRELIRAHLG